jgi:hypothetical protein
MCKACEEFGPAYRIEEAVDAKRVLKILHDAAETGQLRILNGSLEWSDSISCQLACTTCAQGFELSIETYHGSGGQWRQIAAEP